jgi:hypothetical protein
MRGAIPSLRQYAFMAWCLVKIQEQLYLDLEYVIHLYDNISNQLILAVGNE